jgi:transporter family-2 protein
VSKLPYIIAAITIGGLLTLQPGLNADVARRVGSPFGAGLISIFISLVVAGAFLLATRQQVAWQGVATMPWHLWLAGTIGVAFVVGSLWLAPILGAALLFAAVVAGQMIVATLLDHFGFSGYQSQSFDPWRVAGIAFVLAGVWAFQRAA